MRWVKDFDSVSVGGTTKYSKYIMYLVGMTLVWQRGYVRKV